MLQDATRNSKSRSGANFRNAAAECRRQRPQAPRHKTKTTIPFRWPAAQTTQSFYLFGIHQMSISIRIRCGVGCGVPLVRSRLQHRNSQQKPGSAPPERASHARAPKSPSRERELIEFRTNFMQFCINCCNSLDA